MALLRYIYPKFLNVTNDTRYISQTALRGYIDGDTLVAEAAEDSTISKASMSAAARALALQFQELLLRGYSVEVPGIGYFKASGNTFTGQDEDEGLPYTSKRRRVLYRPSTSLKSDIDAASFETRYGSPSGWYGSLTAYNNRHTATDD